MSGRSRRVELFLVTFAILALELTVIRWMSQQVRLFAYLNNVLLISAFLGMGLGVGLGRRRPNLFHWTLPALAPLCLVLATSEALHITHLSMPDDAIAMWGLTKAPHVLSSFAIVALLFAAVTTVFVFAGTRVGEIFAQSETLAAYSADLAGSLAGVVAISLLSFLETTPPVWFAMACLPLAALSRKWMSWIALVAILVFAQLSVKGAYFSPYYRIDLDRAWTMTGAPLRLSVNRDFHQYVIDLSEARLRDPRLPPDVRMRLRSTEQMYRLPFLLAPRHERALVVGAGTGNDVAAALREGFGSVTAVEIDPRIAKLGAIHPERPYADRRTHVVVNDARAWLEQNPNARFDVVAFGLLDSHAMFSAMSTLRLDNYVYTTQALRAAWGEVASPGLLCISFASGNTPWLSDRLYATLRDATGSEPVMVQHGLQNGRFYIAAKGFDVRAALARFGVPMLAPGLLASTIRIPNDDWPYLYLKPGTIAYSYIGVLALILLTAAIGVRRVFRATSGRATFDPVLFLMGAAFLLIETRGVTTLSLLFGSTWIVNSAVFAGILIVAWMANAYVRRHPNVDVRIAMGLLIVALAVNYVIGPEVLLRLPLAARWLLGGVANALPVGLAGIVFSTLLGKSSESDVALGSNLLGAVVGGAAEYLSILLGLRALVPIAAVLYLGAFLLLQRGSIGLAAPDRDDSVGVVD